jgi:hypothetical protein
MQRGTITADIVQTWLEKAPGKPTLVSLEDKRAEISTHDAALGELLDT